MDNSDLIDFVTAYNDALPSQRPETALEWILFIDKAGFQIVRKSSI